MFWIMEESIFSVRITERCCNHDGAMVGDAADDDWVVDDDGHHPFK